MEQIVSRSLKASVAGVEKARLALQRAGLNQSELAEAIPVSRSTVIKFFAGQALERKKFIELCQKLNTDWQEVAELQTATSQADTITDIDALVQQARLQIQPYIREKCGSMRVLDMTQSIELDQIYIRVNILERITGRRGLGQAELLEDACLENFDRFRLGVVREARMPGLETVKKYKKLMILGKPGAGKTTFLKHLAIACNTGKFEAQRVPIFVTLKEFVEEKGEPDLLTYLDRLVAMPLQPILQAGRSLILLDGLDEVRDVDSSRVLKEIQQFSDRFYGNQIVVTCRIAAREYTFQRFTEVEVADFDQAQIAEFVKNWFACKKDEVKGEQFVQKLKDDAPIRELATSPLLLTLLCLSFEDTGDFPANRSELYEDGLDVLLKKWDVKRNIQRDEVYKKLSLKRKEDLLSQIAKTTFEAGNYFFKKKEVERQITTYIQNLPDASTDLEALQLDSEAVLNSIEAQHGLFVERARNIYSFSHLTFHEYFAARKIVTSCNHYAIDDPVLQALVSHITEKRWREVFLLTVGMLESADCLLQLMKYHTDELLTRDKQLQEFLVWLKRKAESTEAPYKPVAIRAFYFDTALNLTLDRALALTLDLDLALALALNVALDLALDRALALTLDHAFSLTPALDFSDALNRELYQKLQQLKEQLPNASDRNQEDFQQWWQVNGHAWTDQLRSVMIEHRNIGHDWQFNDAQTDLLQQYYDANKLLVDCLNSECYVSRAVREEIEATLLLPIAPTEK